MADNDKFLKAIGSAWKKAYAAAHGHGDACEVSELTMGALCTLLRDNGGCPEFGAFRDILEPFFEGADLAGLWSGDPVRARRQCDQLARHYANDGVRGALAGIAAKVAAVFITKSQVEAPIAGEVGEVFAEQLLLEVRKSLFIDRLDCAPKVMARFEMEHNGNVQRAADALFDFQSAIEEHLPQQLKQVAHKLAADASGQTLPKRSGRAPKRSAAEFVNLKLA